MRHQQSIFKSPLLCNRQSVLAGIGISKVCWFCHLSNNLDINTLTRKSLPITIEENLLANALAKELEVFTKRTSVPELIVRCWWHTSTFVPTMDRVSCLRTCGFCSHFQIATISMSRCVSQTQILTQFSWRMKTRPRKVGPGGFRSHPWLWQSAIHCSSRNKFGRFQNIPFAFDPQKR